METTKKIQEEAWNMLSERGFSISEKMKIRKIFMDFGAEHAKTSNIENDGEYFKNKNVKGYAFSSEKEAIFIEHLLNFLPENVNIEKAIETMSIIIKLYDIKSEWAFNGMKR